jgi:hypothetical protein
LAIANRFGGLVAGIWLLVMGDWVPLIQGIIFAFVGCFALSFALMPSLAVTGLGAAIFSRAGIVRWFGVPFFMVGGVLQYLAFAVYIAIVYHFVFGNHFSSSPWVVALWAFCIISGTFGYMAQREAAASGGRVDGSLIFAVLVADILAAIWGVGVVERWEAVAFFAIGLLWLAALALIVSAIAVKEIRPRSAI